MKIDKWFFDSKGRYWSFYIALQRWTFMICFDIADWDFELHIGKCKTTDLMEVKNIDLDVKQRM